MCNGSTLQVQNRHGKVSIDGSTATLRMGVDGEWDEILAGIAVGKTTGDARFDWAPCTDRCSGRMEADLTSVQAYARGNPRPHLSFGQHLATEPAKQRKPSTGAKRSASTVSP